MDSAQKETVAPPCDQQRALLLVQQQAAEARLFDNPVAQISVMIRAADLLWPYQQEAARAIFTEMYDLAAENFQRKDVGFRTEAKGVTVRLPDQRFVVMSAIARRDADWARRLAERVADETRRDTEKTTTSIDRKAALDTGEKLVELASSLIAGDKSTALALVRSSFRHPASYKLNFFLFDLAKTDQATADQLYREAVNAYANGTAEDLMYLSVYPFALNREAGPVRIALFYKLPSNFVANPQLQRMFLEALFRQAETKFKVPEQPVERNQPASEQQQLLTALTVLEPLIAQHQPAYSQRAAMLKVMAASASSEQSLQRTSGFVQHRRAADEDSDFENLIEKIGRETDPAKRDFAIAKTVLAAPDAEGLARAESLMEKVSDAELRRQLLNWLYFARAQRAVKDGLLDEATRFSEKVEELDFRAVLAFEIAAESLKRFNDLTRARELLDGVAKIAQRAPDTTEKARVLLGVAYLFTKFDGLRAAETMNDAVKTINQLTSPDFTATSIHRRVAGNTFAVFTSYQVPGISLEKAFRELGPSDFEGALSIARNLTDRHLRAVVVIALSASCLEKLSEESKPVKKQAEPRAGKSPNQKRTQKREKLGEQEKPRQQLNP